MDDVSLTESQADLLSAAAHFVEDRVRKRLIEQAGQSYDEDAGVHVNQHGNDPMDHAAAFALIGLARRIASRLSSGNALVLDESDQAASIQILYAFADAETNKADLLRVRELSRHLDRVFRSINEDRVDET